MATAGDITVGLNIRRDKTIRELQTSLPWTIRYSRDYRANPQPHKDFTHALLHVGKALGKLQGLADDMDHDRDVADQAALREQYGKYLADLVICAVRAANVFPGGVVDLQTVTEDRIESKNEKPAVIDFSFTGKAKDKIAPCSTIRVNPEGPQTLTGTCPAPGSLLRWDVLDYNGDRLGELILPKDSSHKSVVQEAVRHFPGTHRVRRDAIL